MMYPWFHNLSFPQVPPQAVCITGVTGLGQAQWAELYALNLLNANQLMDHPDFLRLTPEPGKSIGIDAVRDIHQFCLFSPTRASRKIVFIDDADALTLAAQQAFLKTLEEPITPVTFILLTTCVNQLLPTLRSRCQIIKIPSVPYQQAASWFNEQHVTVSSEDYALTDGAPLMVLEPAFQDRCVAYQLLTEVLKRKLPDATHLKQLVKADPLNVLAGFYYALMRQNQFTLLDACITLRKKYAENANLNWDMQLNSFILGAQSHVV